MKQTFEEFLVNTFTEEAEVKLSDKLFDVKFEIWLQKTDLDLFIAYVEKWHAERMLVITNEVINK